MEKSYNLKQNHEIGCLKTRILYHPYKEYPQTLGALSSLQNKVENHLETLKLMHGGVTLRLFVVFIFPWCLRPRDIHTSATQYQA